MNMISRPSNVREPLTNKFHLAFLVLAWAVVSFPAAAWSADQAFSISAKSRKTVAAGFGFQDAESSSITVKTYDAETGQVLSADTYELDIKDDGPPSSHPPTRIFAGGVGVGVEGLSEFTLRVYDAANGRFLWEGRLNLRVGNPEFGAYRVMAQIQPRAVVTKIANQTKSGGQPYFVLRAVNPQTGQIVWADEFSADAAQARLEYINRSVIGMMGVAPRDIDFRIKMPDEAGRRLLWEDKVVPSEEEAAVPSDEATDTLPGRAQSSSDPSKKKAI